MSFIHHLWSKVSGQVLVDSSDYLERGQRYLAEGQLQLALAEFRQAAALATTTDEQVAAYFERGRAHSRLHQYEAAITDFDQAAALAPAFGQLYLERGACYVLQGDHTAAIADFDRAIALLPPGIDLAKAYCNRGVTYDDLQDFPAALRDIEQAIAIAPEFSPAYTERDRIEKRRINVSSTTSQAAPHPESSLTAEEFDRQAWGASGENDLVTALVLFGRAIELRPQGPDAYYGRGVANAKLGRNEKALADLNMALALRPCYPAALTERGLMYVNRGLMSQGMADYDAALSLDPAYVVAHMNKGSFYAMRGEWRKALVGLDRAIKLDPTFAEARFNRAGVREKLGEGPGAIEDLTTFLQHYRQDDSLVQEAQHRLERLLNRFGTSQIPWSVRSQMWAEFVMLPLHATIADLLQCVQTNGAYYVVVRLPTGRFAVESVYHQRGLRSRLTEIADVIGSAVLRLRLEQIVDMWYPCIPVELDTGETDAHDTCDACGGRTLVVMAGNVIGVLDTRHDYRYPDCPTVLFGDMPVFGRELCPSGPNGAWQCYACQATFPYFVPVVSHDGLMDYACPSCGASPIHKWIESRMKPGGWSQDGFLGEGEELANVIAEDNRTLERLHVTHDQIAAALDELLDKATTGYEDYIAACIERMIALACDEPAEETTSSLNVPIAEIDSMLARAELPPAEAGIRQGDFQVFLDVFLGYQFCPWTILQRPWSSNLPGQPSRIERRKREVHIVSEPGVALPCQQGLTYRYADRDFIIINRQTKQYLRGPGLIVHLIGAHHFFEGKSSPYRVDPEHAARVLGLV